MNNHTLVRMANQIGSFFDTMPDIDQAYKDTARHIKKFWDPRMRIQIMDYLDQQNGEGLSDFVLQALIKHRQIVEDGLSPDALASNYGYAPSRV